MMGIRATFKPERKMNKTEKRMSDMNMKKNKWSVEARDKHRQKMLHRRRHTLNVVEREEFYRLNLKYGLLKPETAK